jgi:hypothetical protein
MSSFVATTAAVEEQADVNTFLVGLSEDETGEGEHLILQRSCEFSDQDRRLGMATYCLVTPSGTAYGGVVSCTLKDRTLEIDLSRDNAVKLGTSRFKIDLAVDAETIRRVRDGLRRIFPKEDRPAQFDV